MRIPIEKQFCYNCAHYDIGSCMAFDEHGTDTDLDSWCGVWKSSEDEGQDEDEDNCEGDVS